MKPYLSNLNQNQKIANQKIFKSQLNYNSYSNKNPIRINIV